MEITDKKVMDVLRNVIDPEVGINIVDMGFIYGIDIKGKKIHIKMTLTVPSCPMKSMFLHEVENALKMVFDDVEVEVELVFDPAWTPQRMSKDAKEKLGIKQ
ncbi:MAG: metal-sulfur cluster assembly factor [Candidatus Peribacteraceae bacterium]|nr:metal-sulfur cluster assembly factor [Candidatus Peribacteraceae bacterium]